MIAAIKCGEYNLYIKVYNLWVTKASMKENFF